MADPNKACYQDNKMVYKYARADYLLKPEVMLLYKFEEKLKSMRMLDIGVGGGRTTRYFAHRVKSYIGIDYSEKMVKACQKKYPDLEFLLCDVRNMEPFEDNSFDLILFSFNGIDCISQDDRLKALQEIRRVCKKPGGIFFFSSHNLNCIPDYFSFKFSYNPFILFINSCKFILLRLKNINIEYKHGYAIIKDGDNFFRFSYYYILPKVQISQLENAGFSNIRLYELDSGTEITDDIQSNRDLWIHYLCES